MRYGEKECKKLPLSLPKVFDFVPRVNTAQLMKGINGASQLGTDAVDFGTSIFFMFLASAKAQESMVTIVDDNIISSNPLPAPK
jgi:hypothetical protein